MKLEGLMRSNVIGTNYEAFGHQQYEVIHEAVKAGNIELIKSLIEKGVNINELSIPDEDEEPDTTKGFDALTLALISSYDHSYDYDNKGIKAEYFEIAKILIENGANVNGDYYRPLYEAIKCDSEGEIIKLMLQKGANTEIIFINTLPLLEACSNLNENAVKLLLQYGANVNSDNYSVGNSYTPLTKVWETLQRFEELEQSEEPVVSEIRIDITKTLFSHGASVLAYGIDSNDETPIFNVLLKSKHPYNEPLKPWFKASLLVNNILGGELKLSNIPIDTETHEDKIIKITPYLKLNKFEFIQLNEALTEILNDCQTNELLQYYAKQILNFQIEYKYNNIKYLQKFLIKIASNLEVLKDLGFDYSYLKDCYKDLCGVIVNEFNEEEIPPVLSLATLIGCKEDIFKIPREELNDILPTDIISKLEAIPQAIQHPDQYINKTYPVYQEERLYELWGENNESNDNL
jgi:ankyrin repeat protein